MKRNDLFEPRDKAKSVPTEAQMLARMARLCSRAEHSEADIEQRLRRSGIGDDAVACIMARLLDEHYIDNSRFARAYVHEKAEFSGWGRRKIELGLRQKGVPQSLWAEAFAQLDNMKADDNLRQMLASKNRTVRATDNYTRRGKLIRFALSRGFEMSQILRCLPAIAEDDYVEADFE